MNAKDKIEHIKKTKNMKKTFFLITSALLMAGCNGIGAKIGGITGTDDSLAAAMGDFEDEFHEEGEADETEATGLALYEAEVMDISELPETAEEKDRQGNLVLYVNTEQEPTEDEPTGIYSVWMADEKAEEVCKILTTNPTAEGLWDQMKGKEANAAPTEMHLIAAAESVIDLTELTVGIDAIICTLMLAGAFISACKCCNGCCPK